MNILIKLLTLVRLVGGVLSLVGAAAALYIIQRAGVEPVPMGLATVLPAFVIVLPFFFGTIVIPVYQLGGMRDDKAVRSMNAVVALTSVLVILAVPKLDIFATPQWALFAVVISALLNVQDVGIDVISWWLMKDAPKT